MRSAPGASLGVTLALVILTGCEPAQTPTESVAATAPPEPLTAAIVSTSGITDIVVDSVELAFGGREFGDVGSYEWVNGEYTAEVDPQDPHNAVIVNLDRAPRNAKGRVEYMAEYRILKPVDMSRGNRTLWYDVMNRGHQRAFNLIQGYLPDYGIFPETAEDIGDGFQLNLGYTMVWTGWQASATGPDRIGAELPIAKNPDGSPITEWRTTEIRGDSASVAIEGRLYPTVAASMPDARLYRRDRPHSEPVLLPRDSWSFATCTDGGASVPSDVDLCLDGGFSADALYYLYHEVRDPIVMGIGFVAVRDATSFLRYDTSLDNPLVSGYGGEGEPRNVITTALAWGQSQPGRFLRDFVYQGFNRDPVGRRAFDGVIATTAGSRKTNTNYQFGNPGRFVRSVMDHYDKGDQFPFAYVTMFDPVSGRIDGILARCSITDSCPKIMHFDSANELWAARGSLVTTDPLGQTDAPIPDNVRIYQWASTQHNQSGLTGYESIQELEAQREAGYCAYFYNNAMPRENRRALVVAFQDWLANGTEPPPSSYSKIADGTLVPPLPRSGSGFPNIPGSPYTGVANDGHLNDYRAIPARHTSAAYTILVPRVDSDGNDIAGIRATQIQVPLATHVGWNYRRAGHIEGGGCSTSGSVFPFATTAAERDGDPRLSLEERYETHAGYVEKIRESVQQQMNARLLLQEDAERLIRGAEQRDIGLPES
ncbi:MAG: alpha/beta hydrolase domain-containing protein [Candidatus Rariloculaceae bacterium]